VHKNQERLTALMALAFFIGIPCGAQEKAIEQPAAAKIHFDHTFGAGECSGDGQEG